MSDNPTPPQTVVNVQPPGVTIGLVEIYDKVVALDAKLTPLVDPQVGVVAVQKDHETRLR